MRTERAEASCRPVRAGPGTENVPCPLRQYWLACRWPGAASPQPTQAQPLNCARGVQGEGPPHQPPWPTRPEEGARPTVLSRPAVCPLAQVPSFLIIRKLTRGNSPVSVSTLQWLRVPEKNSPPLTLPPSSSPPYPPPCPPSFHFSSRATKSFHGRVSAKARDLSEDRLMMLVMRMEDSNEYTSNLPLCLNIFKLCRKFTF